ncbi:efflux RND transporter permease subunit [Bremerella sp. JC817]|uniref:efflux RND transporter permease subunit n=1 Tax=Bremerella sp. JC817 TaxID=3231756 RepID=UPI003457F077
MKTLVDWAMRNQPAMNILMIAAIVGGFYFTSQLNRELFPDFEMETVMVTVSYPGATPDEVEQGICQKIEEAVRSVTGIRKITSTATEGNASVSIELMSNVSDPDRVLNEIRSEVDRISSFPEMAEDAEVRRQARQETAIRVGLLGPPPTSVDAALKLREVAEQVREELLGLPGVADIDISGAKDYQIDIEIPEERLRSYGLSLSKVASIVAKENYELPGGTIRDDSQEILLRGHSRKLYGEEIAELPLLSGNSGTVLTIGEIGIVRDEFTDTAAICEINGEPGLALSVIRNKTDDLLAVVDEVYQYVETADLPDGYHLVTWSDQSVDVRERVQLLIVNGLQGLALVAFLLALFLDLRAAFWVAIGIPFCVFVTGAYLYFSGQTLNMLSMFAFIMALGIVVDDAIVVCENIHAHQQMGKTPWQAAFDGTSEVVPSVMTAVLTTVAAFVPLLFVTGQMGKMLSVMPVALLAMLIVSMLEAFMILPCHMSHHDSLVFRAMRVIFYPFIWVVHVIGWLNRLTSRVLDTFIQYFYLPTLRLVLANKSISMAMIIGLLVVSGGLIRAGIVPFVFLGKIDSKNLVCSVTFPDGTPVGETDRWTRRITEAFETLNERFAAEGTPLAQTYCRVVGSQVSLGPPGSGSSTSGASHKGSVEVELVSSQERPLSSAEILSLWRDEVGEIPGVDSLTFDTMFSGPGGTPIQFKLMASSAHAEELSGAVELCKQQLERFPGVFDVADDAIPGKWEYRVRVKEDAMPLGVTSSDLANTLRNAYYGAEVMRIQRGRHEVKIMVRYPLSDRQNLANFRDVWVRTDDGVERPLSEIADVEIVRGYSEINRMEQKRTVTISADVDEGQANAFEVVQSLQTDFVPILKEQFPNVSVRWEGQQEQTQESVSSLLTGFIVALLAILVLLAIEFKSYFQPLLIMAIIPFALIGAVLGHWYLGRPLELFSLLGLVGLCGIVVNDSIVLVDFINHRVKEGIPLGQALEEAGTRRLRPVLLTSVTTVGGLMPLMFETSRQAQMLIPMATSIACGLMVSTLLVLYMVPVFYAIYVRIYEMTIGPFTAGGSH